ncbi:hypothetical protein HDV00_000210 [Rhizophlyctis rosea]|nr:hypothetical protein HDV00_000210 [Rhizophlyctis rosea]
MARTDAELLDFHIIGGGPVGFCAALLLAKEGYRSTVYERNLDIPNNPEESYPIGVNPRGLHALEKVDPALADKIRESGQLVDSWQVYGPNDRRYAKIDSGVVVGTSRAVVNLELYEYAKTNPLITIKFGHKITSIDFDSQTLTFSAQSPNTTTTEIIHVDASHSKILACDGAYSQTRTLLAQHDPTFTPTLTPWTYEFRVLFAPPSTESPTLDPKVHYIFNGAYTAAISSPPKTQWTCVLSTRPTDPPAKQSLILSKEATPANVEALKNLIKNLCPRFAPLLTEDEARKFFTRRTFTGQIVSCPRLHHAEWLLLLGDAAHSVIPPVGEGINSGLQDCLVFHNTIRTVGISTTFSTYSAKRMKDIEGLTSYAMYQNECPSFVGEVAARRMFMILESAFLRPNIGERLFGTGLDERKGYAELVGPWRGHKSWLLPVCRVVCYPFAGVWVVGRWVVWGVKGIVGVGAGRGRVGEEKVQ